MFAFAILIGIYSYGIFALGVAHLLYPVTVIILSIGWLIAIWWWFKRDIKRFPHVVETYIKRLLRFSTPTKLLLTLLIILWIINLIGALAPEISFDALWYHLTIPKIFVENHAISYIPGGLYYYSLMPKLIDLLYVPSVMLQSAVGAKLIHYMFGVMTLIVLYKISRYYLSQFLALLVLVIFSSNLVVAWEATTAYIDLGRTFFEIMAVYGIVLYIHEKKKLWLIESAVMLGFAISTKLIALGSLVILLAVVFYVLKNNFTNAVKTCLLYAGIAILIPLPYFVLALLYTGNPFYPVFSDILTVHYQSLGPIAILSDIWHTFVTGDDPVNPIYLIVLPLLIVVWRYFSANERLIGIYVIASIVVWILVPRTGGGRFILPYLPAFSILTGLILFRLRDHNIRKLLLWIVVIVVCITIGYRILASIKYAPVIFGQESRNEYLIKNLNFSFGDFYDTTGYFEQNVTDEDVVLVYGFHNLWYANFPFIHESYIQPGNEFNYVLAPNDMRLPERFSLWTPVYSNEVTRATLYTQGGNTWIY